MMLAKSEPVIERQDAEEQADPHGRRGDVVVPADCASRGRPAEYAAATRNASVEVHAHGTWKKTIREDSPMNPFAGSGHRNAAAMTAAM